MSFMFDSKTDRYNTGCVKYDAAESHHKNSDILPMWVADMDFTAPKEVLDALQQKVSHGIFGYPIETPSYYQTVSGWFSKNFGWENDTEWIVPIPGVVYAIACAIRAFTEERDSVLILQPVYHPFANTTKANNRNLVISNLVNTNGRYTVDYEDFEKKIVENNVRLFILCSPHNPVGRVWEKEELQKMGEICLKHGVIVVSDEIHADFVYAGHRHTIFASISEDLAQNCIVCTAPTKTFNLAGLEDSNIFIPNPVLREKFRKALSVSGGGMLNIMGLTAAEAAYTYGKPWKDAMLTYLQGNIDYLHDALETLDMGIHFAKPEGTYLLWLDCRGMGLSNEEMHRFWDEKANIWLNEGDMFGKAGEGFMRLNIACQRSTVEEAVRRLEQAKSL